MSAITMPALSKRRATAVVLLGLAVFLLGRPSRSVAQTPAQVGQWSAVRQWPIVAVHAMLLPSGNVLAWTDYTINEGAQLWNPSTNTFTPKPETTVGLFCAGHILLPDGRLLVAGGIVGLQDDLGPRNTTIFNPVTQSWSQGALMATGRYYPTVTTLPDGRVLVQGGTTTCSSCVADMPEIYNPVADTWTQLAASARMAFKYYPHSFVLPDGRVLVSSQDDQAISSRVLNLSTQTWTTIDSRVLDGHSAAMYLPGKIIKAGTATADNPGLPSAATTYVLDMTQPTPAWQATASMANPRSYLNLTILPDGQVLATGGSRTTDKANFSAAVYPAELWSPVSKTWTTMSSMQTPRLYHSTALLLPDATVLVAGGGRENGRSQPDPADEPNAEIFSPPYLFKGPRPVISSVPFLIQYGTSFFVSTPDAARVASVSLIGLGAVTHAFNENQRFVPLTFQQISGGLNVHAPADGNTAPPGPYMLFLVDTNGVPSISSMVRVPVASAAPAPSITSLSATSGAVGTSLTITGANFGTAQGTNTVTFNGASAGTASSWSAASITVMVPGNASSGNVVVTVGNVASNGVNFTVVPAAGSVALVQHASKDAGTTSSSSLAFAANNTAGNWIGVVMRASTSGQVFTVADTRGNTYRKAIQFNETVDGTTLGIFYAENIAGGANTITVSDTISGTLRFAILEYSGVALANSLDGTPAATQGTSAAPSSGNMTTTASGDLLLGAISTGNPASYTAGSGYVIEETVPAEPSTKLIAEDQIQASAGTVSANATLGASDIWGAAMAAFKAASGGGTGPSITATAGTPQSATINTAFATQLQATVKDSLNNPVSGVTVTFTVNAAVNGASGAFTGGNTTMTDAQGIARANTFTANGTAGSYTVTASATGATSANFSLTNAAGAPATVTPMAGTPQSATINTAFATQLQATVKDSLNNPVSGVTVTFAAPASGASGTFAGGVTTAMSNAQGVAIAAIFTANNIAGGPYNVTASATGATPASFSLTNLASAPVSIALVQHTSKDAGTTSSSSLAFAANNTAGNWIGVVMRASTSGQVFTVADTRGNTYRKAIQFNETVDGTTLGIFYAENIAGGANTITVSDTISGTLRFAILEYSGVALANSLDGTPAATQGTSAAPSSGNMTTTASGDLLLGAISTANPASYTAGSGYVIEETVPAEPSTKLIAEDQIQLPAGTASASVSLAASDSWGAGLAAFKAAGGAPPPAPSITNVNPTSGPVGMSVTITGTNFGASQGTTSTVTFNGTLAAPASSWGPTSIGVVVPAGATPGYVVVTVGGVASNGVAFTVTTPGPSISTLSMTQGPVGATVTITGTNFGASQGTSTVSFGTTSAGAASNWGPASIDVHVPAMALGSVSVVVTVGGVASNGVPFTVTPPPSITSLSPTSGPVGTVVTINGANFGPTVGTRTSFVTFSGTTTRSNSWSDTQIVAPVPNGATTGNVVVSISGVVSNAVNFTVTLPPSIASLNPTFGPVGTSVTITGTNFGATRNTSTVTFNGTAATPSIWSDTSISAPVPAGATTGNVVVTVGGGGSPGVNFTVTSSGTPITLVQHTSKDAGTTTSSSLAFAANNTAGNWIGVTVRASAPGQAFTVADSKGNTYHKAIQLNETVDGTTLAIFYAENIAGGANTITVSDTISGTLRFAILEYSGVAFANSLDAAMAAQGTSASPNTGNVTTLLNGDLLLGAISTGNPASYTAGSGYATEESVPAEPSTKLIAEDQIQTTAGPASASASLGVSDNWGAALAAFRSASAGPPPPISISVSPTTANVPTGGTQGFAATVQNDPQHLGATFSLSGAGCSGNTCGTLTNVTTTTVTYTAPPNAPSPATVTLTATSVTDNTKSGTATITVVLGPLTVTISPKRGSITRSQTQQFTSTVFNDPNNAGVTWQVDGNTGGNTTVGTISPAGLFTPGTQAGLHTIAATSVTNASVNTSVTFAVSDLQGVYTYHNDVARTGQNLNEYALTPATVNSSTFSKLFSCPVDGFVYAEPLYVANLTIGGTPHNVVYIATEHDSVYAFDADSPSCFQLWKTSFLGPGVTTMSWLDTGSNPTDDVYPEIGITSTPVIDPATNTIYVEAKTKETVGAGCTMGSPCYFQRLHALDILTGLEKLGGPIVISAPNFDPLHHMQRPALLLANGTLYIGFGSHGDLSAWQGWLFGYDAAILARKFVWSAAVAASGGYGGGIWGGGAGPSVDANGNIYVETGNGTFDANTGGQNYSDSVVKLSPTGAVLDYFTPFDQATFRNNDVDLGSAGTIILPDAVGSATHPHLALATGKVAILYLLDQANMGKFNAFSNQDVQEVIPVPPPNTTQLDGGNYGLPAYWNGNIYTTGQNYPLSQFRISNGSIATPQFAVSNNRFPPRGATPAVSASGTTNGIVWILDLTAWPSNGTAILDAYDATNVSTLLFSSPSSGPGAAGAAVKFAVPTVANGKVYVGGQASFTVFGLLPN